MVIHTTGDRHNYHATGYAYGVQRSGRCILLFNPVNEADRSNVG